MNPTLAPTSLASTNSSLPDSSGKCCHKYKIFSVVYIIVFIFGFTANVLALYVFIKLRHKRNASNTLMVNLSISDLLFSLTLPIRITYYFTEGTVNLGNITCAISTYIFYLNMYTSIFFLMTLSIFRYIAVIYEIRAKEILTVRRATIITIAIWIIVASATTPVFFSPLQGNGSHCFEIKNENDKENFRVMNYIGLLGFVLPFLIIIVCYGCIIRQLRASGRQSLLKGRSTVPQHKQSRRNSRSIALAAVVLLVFLFCFLPYHIHRTVYLHQDKEHTTDCSCNTINTFSILTMCLAVANCCIDPLIYYFLSGKFCSFLKFPRKRNESAYLQQNNLGLNVLRLS
ncbi:cysteinyl leukotriene receptor 1-like [Protopterus annectens]|uniref:cysteinyl leukotriene receptor 1-like n=1 Tax=Protopterus annectens TaxID=7888 RepID=UPI001CF9DEA2|nr:cysteinyl leukotriene receptor 1-like [Protopterus annectens]XP_043932937.1 cysteinyl leukotriene receptor 1-like [Protopterus annectens]XP_043932938.1 cysteinyl leukotriene receptor 1-like [Protopterus annectens]XP_043932939.1 cysteinyl leukotriene receptor 1-like [Protopterus annectens]